jgi:hypothetical protein
MKWSGVPLECVRMEVIIFDSILKMGGASLLSFLSLDKKKVLNITILIK